MAKRTFILNKLVRDGIVANTEEIGGSAVYKKLKGDHKIQALIDKIKEEIEEFRQNGDNEELAQTLSVFDALTKELGLTKEELNQLEKVKKHKLGGFDGGIFVEKVSVPSDHWLSEYYGSQPERFPEIEG